MTEPTDRAVEARRFVRAHLDGVLSTLSVRMAGAPFGSICPFVLDHAGGALILVSGLAEHTRNLEADPRCSLLAHSGAADPQAAGRVTLVGRAARAEVDAATRARYLRLLPEAAANLELPDFRFLRIAVDAVRYIGGFGNIHWLPGEDFTPPPNSLAEAEADILAHMNADHAELLPVWCARYHGVQPRAVEMVGVDVDGIDLRADGARLRVDFARSACDPDAVRRELVALARAA